VSPRSAIVLCALACASPAVAMPPRAAPLRVCADVWPPYTDDARAPRPGYASELVTAALQREGLSSRYVTMPWTRCLEEVRAGRAAAAIGLAEDEAPDLLPGLEPVGLSVTAIFTPAASTLAYRGIASLQGLRVGAVQGYGFGEPFDAFLEEGARTGSVVLVSGEDAPERLVAMLEAGRIDVLLEDPLVFRETVRRTGHAARSFREAGRTGLVSTLWVGFAPGRKDLADRFDAGVRGLRRSGELSALLARYGLADWAPSARAPPGTASAPAGGSR